MEEREHCSVDIRNGLHIADKTFKVSYINFAILKQQQKKILIFLVITNVQSKCTCCTQL